MSEQTYCIYKHTSPSGKSYIGQTMNYKQRVRAHKNLTANATIFASAIKKYGWENFTSEIIKYNLSLDDANAYEAFYIAEHNTLVPNGYNVAVGGLNSKPTNDTKDKIKATQLSRSADASEITRMYFDNPENIKKHSEIMKGKANTEKARESIYSM